MNTNKKIISYNVIMINYCKTIIEVTFLARGLLYCEQLIDTKVLDNDSPQHNSYL